MQCKWRETETEGRDANREKGGVDKGWHKEMRRRAQAGMVEAEVKTERTCWDEDGKTKGRELASLR